jgi:ABC-type branched-subunit amino acid transport system substrate-binding protein
MSTLPWCRRRAFLGAAASAPWLPAGAAPPAAGAPGEPGVSADAVVISRVISLDGPAGAKGREQEAALQAYFGAVNAAGGVHGRRIVLRTSNTDLRSEEAFNAIFDSQRPFALFLFGGTANSAIAMKRVTQGRVPFVAPNSGAIAFHQPFNRYVFNVRARYQDEVVAAIRHFALLNQRRLALLHVDDPFGRDGAEGYRAGIQASGLQSVYEANFGIDQGDFKPQATALAAAAPQAVVCVGSSKRVSALIAAARPAGVTATFMTLSNNSSAGFARELGPHARGVVVSQVMPPPAARGTRLSRELLDLLAPSRGDPSYAAMEALASAKVLVEGLRRAGPALTREGFVRALESMQRFDLGGLEIDYSPRKRSGSSYVELSILTEDGKYRR